MNIECKQCPLKVCKETDQGKEVTVRDPEGKEVAKFNTVVTMDKCPIRMENNISLNTGRKDE